MSELFIYSEDYQEFFPGDRIESIQLKKKVQLNI